jgi:trigger factor
LSEVQVSLENGSGLERRMRVQVPAGRIEEEVEARLATAGKTAKLKGFRPGKVPAHVIRQRFGMQIRQEVLQDVVQSSYSEAIVQQKLRPAGSPRIEPDATMTGHDLAYTAVFEVYPEFKVAGVDSLAVEKPETDITDADVEATLERLRRQKGEWKPVEREAGTGDRVTIDFTGTRDGEVIEGGKADNVAIVIGDGRMIPDFEAGLVGTRAGAKKTFPVTFPSDYHEESLRGARVSFEVSVHEVAELGLPALDADFIKGYGVATGEMADFRRLVRENLEREVAAKIQAEVRRQVMEHLLAANAIEVPAVMVTREAAGLQAESMRNLGLRDVKDAPAVKAYEEVARRRVRLGLIMGAVIREHDIRVEPARVEQKLDELARPYENPSEVRRLYQQNAELMAQIENSVMEEQVMLWLSDRARVNPKRQTFAELMGV